MANKYSRILGKNWIKFLHQTFSKIQGCRLVSQTFHYVSVKKSTWYTLIWLPWSPFCKSKSENSISVQGEHPVWKNLNKNWVFLQIRLSFWWSKTKTGIEILFSGHTSLLECSCTDFSWLFKEQSGISQQRSNLKKFWRRILKITF